MSLAVLVSKFLEVEPHLMRTAAAAQVTTSGSGFGPRSKQERDARRIVSRLLDCMATISGGEASAVARSNLVSWLCGRPGFQFVGAEMEDVFIRARALARFLMEDGHGQEGPG